MDERTVPIAFPEDKKSVWKSFIEVLPALLIGLVLSLVMLEVTVRVLWPQEERLYQADKYIRTIHKPSVETVREREEFTAKVRTNAQGFVGDDFVKEKGEGVIRIAMLGDSFTEGFWVDEDESYVRLLDEYLHASSTDEFEVYNFGVSGHGTSLNYLTYKHYASKYNPDWVVLQFYVRNDYTNDLMVKDRPEFTTEADAGTLYGSVREFLYNNFQAPRFIIRSLKKIYAVNQFLADMNIITRQHDPNVREYPLYFEAFNAGETEVYDQAFADTCAIVAQLKTEVEANGGQVAAFIIPAKEQFYEADWQEWQETYSAMRAETWDLRRPSNAISGCFASHEIAHIDLEDRFAQHVTTSEERLYYRLDDHLNELGNQLAAEELARFVTTLTTE